MDKDYIDIKNWLKKTYDEPLENMDIFFDKRIETYEEHMAKWKNYYSWMSSLIPKEAKTLLDIGCGTGLELDEIFKRFPSLLVTGIDLSKEMLLRLKKKHRDKDINLINEDYFTHDFGSNYFDVVISFETLHHFTQSKKEALFFKIHKCLKPGGVYLECDYIAKTQEIEDLVFSESQRRRIRDNIKQDIFVHFDTPLTLDHELEAIKNGGFKTAELVGYLNNDENTAMIKAIK